jgi:Na+-driven multidrug efflux pump
MIITGIVNSMGVVASASVGIVSRVFSFGGIFPIALGSAIAAMTAQNIGAGRPERALKALRWGITYSLAFCGLFFIYCQISPQTITALFARASETDVIMGSAEYLRAFSIDLLLVAVIFPTNSYLSGCGKSAVSMIHSMIATFAVRIPLSILVSGLAGYTLGRQLYLLGLASPIASAPSIIISYAYIYWRVKKGGRTPPDAGGER